ncbi:MAG: uroporphyrinogen decarboxylase family protein [Sphaerochaeta sp.]|nr:uroporphyrinogen decarboxylase family protein [Sphaerochaeta sp.]
MISTQISISKGWLHELGNFRFTEAYYWDPTYRAAVDRKIDEYLVDTFKDFPVHNFESNLVQKDFIAPNMVRIGAIQPNLILGTLLGANLIFPEDADSDIDRSPLKDIARFDELPPVKQLLHHALVQQLDSQIETALQDTSKITIPPFFWDTSGRATIHGIFTTAHKLVGEQFFLLMYDNPPLAHAVLAWIADAYVILLRHFSQLGGMHTTSVHIGECSGCLISKRDFEIFAKPYIEVFGSHWPLRVHSCGLSDHLIDSLTHIRNVRSLDVGSNTSIRAIRSRLGKQFLIEVAPPVEILLKGAEDQASVEWLEKTIEENGDGPLKISCHLEPGYSTEFLAVLTTYSRTHPSFEAP